MNSKNSIEELKNALRNSDSQDLSFMMTEMIKLMSYYRCALLEVETKFKVLSEQFSLTKERNPIESIKTRLKTFDSINAKLAKRGLHCTPTTVENELHDVAGIRIICSYIDDIYMLAKSFLSQDDVTLIETKDYIRSPKPNGYRSLHLIIEIPIFLSDEKKYVRVEVQFRTIAMESWANIEHQLRYKKEYEKDFEELLDNELCECAEISHRLDLKMQQMRILTEKFPHEN